MSVPEKRALCLADHPPLILATVWGPTQPDRPGTARSTNQSLCRRSTAPIEIRGAALHNEWDLPLLYSCTALFQRRTML